MRILEVDSTFMEIIQHIYQYMTKISTEDKKELQTLIGRHMVVYTKNMRLLDKYEMLLDLGTTEVVDDEIRDS